MMVLLYYPLTDALKYFHKVYAEKGEKSIKRKTGFNQN